MATTVEKIDKIENIHDDVAAARTSSTSRDAEVLSEYRK